MNENHSGSSNGFAIASLVCALIGIPFFAFIIPSVLAVIFGFIGYSKAGKLSDTVFLRAF